MINATEIRRGMILEVNQELYEVLDYQHVVKGNKRSFIQTKMRHLRDGSLKEIRWRADDKVEQAIVEQIPMEYLYQAGHEYIFMNLQNNEQLSLPAHLIQPIIKYLVPNLEVTVNMHHGQPISINLPYIVELKVIKTEPPLKGATVTNVYKPATLETGVVIQVPPYIQVGEIIRVDTRDGKYLERVK